MCKRIISCLIIFSMLWIDIAAAMNEEDKSPPPSSTFLAIKKRDSTNSSHKNGTTEKDPLLNGKGGDIVFHHSVNGFTKESGSSSEEDEKRVPRDYSLLEELRDPLEKKEAKSKTCPCWPPSLPSCCKRKHVAMKEEDVESQKTGCWPLSCCKKSPSEESHREDDHLLIIANDTKPADLKKQALLNLVIALEKERLSDVVHLEEQIVDEQEVILQKAQFLYSKIQGTSLEDFGRWFQGQVVENRYRLQDWGGLVWALIMSAGTGQAMAPIVEYSIYNSFFANHLKQYMPVVGPLAYYINVSTGLTALTDACSFMLEATSPSTRSFTTPKSAKEKRADRILIPLAAISGIYLLLLGFQVQQILKKDEGSKGFWTNKHDQFWLATAVPLFSYLVAQSWKGMRTAVSKVFHPTVPEHVKERVLALRQLDARLNHLSDDAIDDLYDLLKHPLLAQNAKVKAWARYFCKGEIAEKSKVEGLLTYLTLTNYAQEKFKEEVEPEEGSHKTRIASRILAGFGLPAGFSLVAISVFGLFSAFMDWKGALALSITAAALGFMPESFLQAHNVKETLDDISSGPKRGWKDNVKDPYWWGAGAAKVLGTVWSAFQNILTNLAPIFVSLVMLTPQELGGGDTVQKAMTWTMITLAVPYLISELISGTHDMWGHLVGMTSAGHDFCYGIYDRIVACCKKEVAISPRRQKREIRRILKGTIGKTLTFTPQFVNNLDQFERRLLGEEVFD